MRVGSESRDQAAAEESGIRVLVVEDHPLFRGAIVRGLTDGGVEVAQECANGPEALVAYAKHRPDLVICDLHLGRGNMTGVDVVAKLTADFPGTRVIIFSADDDQGSIDAALDAGAVGYVQKSVGAVELIMCVKEAVDGQNVFDKATAAKVIAALRDRGRADKVRLSPREREVLVLMTQGVTSTKGIAEALFIGTDTAKTHCERLMAKLEVSDRAQAVGKAFRDGIVTADDATGPAASRRR